VRISRESIESGCRRGAAKLFSILFIIISSASNAGFISTPAAEFDGFDPNGVPAKIPLVWLPFAVLNNQNLTTINNNADLQALFGAAPDALNIVDAFFVDKINFCPLEPYNPAVNKIVGCGEFPGHAIILDSLFAALVPLGALDIGHEIGHNVGLPHVQGINTNLMNPIIGSDAITEAQFLQIFGSPLVQINPATGLSSIFVRPIAVVAVVAEPETYLLSITAILALILAGRTSKVGARGLHLPRRVCLAQRLRHQQVGSSGHGTAAA
jgi:hypothetical protein